MRKMKLETIVLLQLLILNGALGADPECPMNLDYVHQLPWDKSFCESAIINADCCQTLLSLLGIGLAQYLRDESMFELPSNASAVACLGLFQQQLKSLSLSPDLVSTCCKNNMTGFISSPLLCAGIQTKQDWLRKMGITWLDSACKGDLSDLDACQGCKDSGDLVQKELVDKYKSLTNWKTSERCFYFTVLYAAGVVNEFGPKTRSTAQCILRLPFVRTASYGQGGFATVYRGTLADSRRIAVKRIKNCTLEGDSEFLNEVVIINNIRHRNLVILRGCCVASDEREGHQRFLIYDYMPNGSLDEHLFGEKSKAQPLNWAQRKNIVLGTAKGLAYLHNGIEPAIYLRDIKSRNILLDDDMNACVADISLAKIMTKQGESHITTKVAGTHGYLAPEYALYGQLTDKSDVYSFGVLILEIMSGRKALNTSAELGSHYLITDWAWALVKQGRTSEIVDERIRQSGAETVVMERFVLVGILCSHVMVAFRPRMVDAVRMLEGEAEIPEIPDRPLPLMLQFPSVTDESWSLFISESVSRPSFRSTDRRI